MTWFGVYFPWAIDGRHHERDFTTRASRVMKEYEKYKSIKKITERRNSNLWESIEPESQNVEEVSVEKSLTQIRGILQKHDENTHLQLLLSLLDEKKPLASKCLQGFEQIKAIEKELRNLNSKGACIFKRMIYTSCFEKDMKIVDLERLFNRGRFRIDYARELREGREMLRSCNFNDMIEDIYGGSEWYGPEIQEICKQWFHDVDNYDLSLEGRKSWIDIWGDGNKVFTQHKILKNTTPEENHLKFSAHDDYGKKCKAICGRIPSSEKLHEHKPRDVEFFKKVAPGVHEKKLELKLNFRSLRNWLLVRYPEAAAKLGDDACEFTRSRCCPDTEGEEFLKCISGNCPLCCFNQYFFRHMEAIMMGDVIAYENFDEDLDKFSFVPLLEAQIKFSKYIDVPSVKPGGRPNATLASYYLPMNEFLICFEKQCDKGKELLWQERIQLKAICKTRRAQYLPNNTSSTDYDFSTLVPFQSGIYQSQREWMNSGKFSIETYIMNVKIASVRALKLDATVKKLILQCFSEEKGKDCFTHLVNLENFLDLLYEMAPWIKLTYLNSDGPTGQYKNSKHFIELKSIACARSMSFLLSFCPPGLGKGEHDREGGQTQSIYTTKCCRDLGTEARHLGSSVVPWFTENHSKIKSENSKTEGRRFFHTSPDEVAERRSLCLAVDSLFSLQYGGVTRNNFCFYISHNAEEKGVWIRKFTCLDCDNCLTGEWEYIKQCTNNKCGDWFFVGFDFVNIQDDPWLTEEEKLASDKKKLLRTLPCPCGRNITRNNFYDHNTQKGHLKYIASLNN
jgi:hypothetical protein